MKSILKQYVGAWRLALAACSLLLVAAIVSPTESKADCAPEEAGCSPYEEEHRIRDLAANGCHVRVYYRIIDCSGRCEIVIDSLVYPTYEGDCYNCVHDITQNNMNAIVRHLILHGMYFGPCGDQPMGTVLVKMPACWKTILGSGTGGGYTSIGKCGDPPCCIVEYSVLTSGGNVVGLVEMSRTTDVVPPPPCSTLGPGCQDICN